MQWISVKEKVPNNEEIESKKILCMTSQGIHSAWFPDGFEENGIVGGWETCYYCGGQSRVSFFHKQDTTIEKITHWMPLPDAPNDKTIKTYAGELPDYPLKMKSTQYPE